MYERIKSEVAAMAVAHGDGEEDVVRYCDRSGKEGLDCMYGDMVAGADTYYVSEYRDIPDRPGLPSNLIGLYCDRCSLAEGLVEEYVPPQPEPATGGWLRDGF